MSELNDDMDELFRRAAENYPLKTDSSDWNKLNNSLQASDSTAPASTTGVRMKNYRRLLWFALLLMIPWICYRNKIQSDNSTSVSSAKRNPTNPGLSEAAKEAPLNTNKGSIENKNREEKVAATNALDSKKQVTENSVNAPEDLITANQRSTDLQMNSDREVSDISKDNNPTREANENPQVNNTNREPENNHLKDTGQQHKDLGNLASPLIDTISTAELVNKKIKEEKKKKIARVYVGIFGGGDISTVKFQSVKNAGLNLGVLLGYQLNKKIAIETGAIWDKKFYYSKGEYFSTKKIYLPANSIIDDVEGNCSMIELPFNVKYNFKSSGKTTWFSVLGVSSYFMKTENYDYTLSTAGVYSDRYRTYTNSATNWLSMMNISLGYSHSFGKRKTSNLRIEPYFKISLKGVGIGSLPITSSGINIGFTKTIF